jgi:hypothetical protein
VIEVHQSDINTWFKCPKMFYYGSILKVPEAYSEALFLGSTVHLALKEYFLGSELSLIDLFKSELASQKNFREDPRFKSGSTVAVRDIKNLENMGVELLTSYRDKMLDEYTPLSSELFLTKQITETISVGGTIDLLCYHKKTGESLIVDFKVLGRRKTRTELTNDIQPTVYALLVGGPITFEYHALLKMANPEIEVWRLYRTQSDIDWFVGNILEPFVKCVEQGIFCANTDGWWCSEKFCSYYDICKEGSTVERHNEDIKRNDLRYQEEVSYYQDRLSD